MTQKTTWKPDSWRKLPIQYTDLAQLKSVEAQGKVDKITESVIYCMGGEPIGFFFRTNSQKDAYSNLNSPAVMGVVSRRDANFLRNTKLFVHWLHS